MEELEFERRLKNGEDVSTEFKRCGNKPEDDTFETICSFANRQGGDVFLGVLDDGTIEGVDAQSILPLERNVSNVLNNPKLFNVPPAVEFERLDTQWGTVLRVWVPAGPAVYRFRGIAFDRVADTDVKVADEVRITAMYLRKQNIYTERRVYPFLRESDLRPDLIDQVRRLASTRRSDHPWKDMDDSTLLRSANLYVRDYSTGEEGLSLASALLFGKDETIAGILPAYGTDAILRLDDTDRYDDRLLIATNLIDAYGLLIDFCRKHLPDPFFLDGVQSVSARDIVARELVSNILIHREFTSPLPARLLIDGDGLHTENASRSLSCGRINPANCNPISKNPVIAGVFLQIGYAEKLGSGIRNLYRLSGSGLIDEPVLEDGDTFRAFVPFPTTTMRSGPKPAARHWKPSEPDASTGPTSTIDDAIWQMIADVGYATAAGVAGRAGVTDRSARKHLAALVELGHMIAEGSTNRRVYKATP